MMTRNRMMAAILAGSLASTSLGGCATNGRPLTANQRIARCGAAIIGGGLIGALIGSQVDGRRGGGTGQGAVIGAALGGAACAVWMAFENERDRRRLVEAQLAAARTGRPVADSWTGEDGRMRAVSVVPSTEMQTMVSRRAGEAGGRHICRSVATTPSVDYQTTDPINSYVCRDAAGNWMPASAEMVAVPA